MTRNTKTLWAFAISATAVFMAALDNLVVTTALPSIRTELNVSLEGLEWIVNAYTLTFAVLLLTGAALGDRFGRRRMLAIGIAIFTAASIGAALAPTIEFLVTARAVQGLGGAIIMPLTLTVLSAAVPAEKRGVALGAWGAVAGIAVAFGPLIGGGIVDLASWQWIFWANVPIGIAMVPLTLRKLDETYGPAKSLDLGGLALASSGLFGIVWALVRGNGAGWSSVEVLATATAGLLLVAAFIAWELRTEHPMLPMQFFRNRTFAMANLASLLMSFGLFGSVFLLSQYFQTVQGASPVKSGLQLLPWTVMPMFVAPIAGLMSDRIGGRPVVATGLALQAAGMAWMAGLIEPATGYWSFVGPFAISGIGMSMFWAPIANVVLGSVRAEEEGQASGANNAIRELGGVFGVAVLAAVFSHYGGYETGTTFVDGMTPAMWIGAIALAVAAIAALAIPGRKRAAAQGRALEPAIA